MCMRISHLVCRREGAFISAVCVTVKQRMIVSRSVGLCEGTFVSVVYV